MAQMLLLIHQPRKLFLHVVLCDSGSSDLLSTYTALHRRLYRHALDTIRIARGMPCGAVQRYLVQPLYVAGRALVDRHDRQELLSILGKIDDEIGCFTRYRILDLCREWGIPYHSSMRDSGLRS